MSLEKMEALETRVRRLIDLVQDLRHANLALKRELQLAREQLLEQQELVRLWEQERTHVRSKIEHVLQELDFLEHPEEDLQGVTHDQTPHGQTH